MFLVRIFLSRGGLPARVSCSPAESPVKLAWVLDLVVTALGSIAAIGLACFLIVFGVHWKHVVEEEHQALPHAEKASRVRPWTHN
jgi:hypothetical protein